MFLLLFIANGSPIVARLALGARFALPLDAGVTLFDGRPLFGESKTLRGLLASILLTTFAASLMGLGWVIGFVVAVTAMLGDLTSSFIKRRRGLRSGDMALGLDQVPESLFPLLAVKSLLDLSWTQIIVLTLLFTPLSLLLSRLLFRAGIRRRPH